MDLTVAIVNHRNRERLLETLGVVTAAPVPGRTTEVVVLDNASGDGSVEAVEAAFPAVRVLARPRRAGFGANHNEILRASTGRYALLLNDDALITLDAIGRLADALDDDATLGAVAPRIRYPDGRPQPSAWRFPTPMTTALGTLTLGRRGIVQSVGTRPRRVDWATAAVLLVRRSALEAAGPFDEGFFMYAEETDLQRRLAGLGYGTLYLPSVEAVHHGQGSSGGADDRRINEHWRSRHRYWRRHHSRLGALVAARLTGLQYALRALVAAALLRLPERLRPVAVSPADVARLRLNARNTGGVGGPGLRESAEAWNADHDVEAATR